MNALITRQRYLDVDGIEYVFAQRADTSRYVITSAAYAALDGFPDIHAEITPIREISGVNTVIIAWQVTGVGIKSRKFRVCTYGTKAASAALSAAKWYVARQMCGDPEPKPLDFDALAEIAARAELGTGWKMSAEEIATADAQIQVMRGWK